MAGTVKTRELGRRTRQAALLALIALAAVGAASCGGGGSLTSSSTAERTGSSTEQQAGGGEGTGKQSGGGELKPEKPTDPRSFGQEAGSAESAAASRALEAFMKARAARERTAECSYLGLEAIEPIEEFYSQNQQLKGKPCPALLAALAGFQPKTALENNLDAPIASLRVEGAKAFAIYSGTGGGTYAIPMALEGGDWKVASVVATKLPPQE
jgi:hypothetical protein